MIAFSQIAIYLINRVKIIKSSLKNPIKILHTYCTYLPIKNNNV